MAAERNSVIALLLATTILASLQHSGAFAATAPRVTAAAAAAPKANATSFLRRSGRASVRDLYYNPQQQNTPSVSETPKQAPVASAAPTAPTAPTSPVRATGSGDAPSPPPQTGSDFPANGGPPVQQDYNQHAQHHQQQQQLSIEQQNYIYQQNYVRSLQQQQQQVDGHLHQRQQSPLPQQQQQPQQQKPQQQQPQQQQQQQRGSGDVNDLTFPSVSSFNNELLSSRTTGRHAEHVATTTPLPSTVGASAHYRGDLGQTRPESTFGPPSVLGLGTSAPRSALTDHSGVQRPDQTSTEFIDRFNASPYSTGFSAFSGFAGSPIIVANLPQSSPVGLSQNEIVPEQTSVTPTSFGVNQEGGSNEAASMAKFSASGMQNSFSSTPATYNRDQTSSFTPTSPTYSPNNYQVSQSSVRSPSFITTNQQPASSFNSVSSTFSPLPENQENSFTSPQPSYNSQLQQTSSNSQKSVGAQPQMESFNSQPEQASFTSQSQQGSFNSRSQQGSFYTQSQQGSFNPQSQQGSFIPQFQQGSFTPQSQQGSLTPQSQQGSFTPQPQQGSSNPQSQQGSFTPQSQQGSLTPQSQQGSLTPQSQQGSSNPQSQQGSYTPQSQQGLFNPQSQQGLFNPQSQQGLFNPQSQQGSLHLQSHQESLNPQLQQGSINTQPQQAPFNSQTQKGSFDIQGQQEPFYPQPPQGSSFQPPFFSTPSPFTVSASPGTQESSWSPVQSAAPTSREGNTAFGAYWFSPPSSVGDYNVAFHFDGSSNDLPPRPQSARSHLKQQRQGIPRTNFTCRGKKQGYYADLETGCQVFHICQHAGLKSSFMCPEGSVFNQQLLVCDWWFDTVCEAPARTPEVSTQAAPAATPSTPSSTASPALASTTTRFDDGNDLAGGASAYQRKPGGIIPNEINVGLSTADPPFSMSGGSLYENMRLLLNAASAELKATTKDGLGQQVNELAYTAQWTPTPGPFTNASQNTIAQFAFQGHSTEPYLSSPSMDSQTAGPDFTSPPSQQFQQQPNERLQAAPTQNYLQSNPAQYLTQYQSQLSAQQSQQLGSFSHQPLSDSFVPQQTQGSNRDVNVDPLNAGFLASTSSVPSQEQTTFPNPTDGLYSQQNVNLKPDVSFSNHFNQPVENSLEVNLLPPFLDVPTNNNDAAKQESPIGYAVTPGYSSISTNRPFQTSSNGSNVQPHVDSSSPGFHSDNALALESPVSENKASEILLAHVQAAKENYDTTIRAESNLTSETSPTVIDKTTYTNSPVVVSTTINSLIQATEVPINLTRYNGRQIPFGARIRNLKRRQRDH